MDRAIQLSAISTGGPFGAVIVDKKGNIIGEGHNEVTLINREKMLLYEYLIKIILPRK
jgi:tRNA(Arg) A34 adenosine deaminase TadA